MTASPDQPLMPTTTYSDIEICDFLASGGCGGSGAGGVNWYYNNTLISAQPGGDFDDLAAGGTNVSIVASNDAPNSRVHYVFSSVEQFQNAGVAVGAEPILNLIPGSNVTLSPFVDDAVNHRVSVTVNSTGGGGGSPNQAVTFTNQTTVTLATTFTSTNLLTACYDTASPANAIYPANVSVSSAFVVTWTFTVAQSGTCVVNGLSGGGGGGAVTSVFGRTGAVIAQSGDYSFSLISGTAAESQLPATTLFSDQNFTAGAKTFDFSGATAFKLPVAGGLATSANGSIGYDSTAANWHAYAGSADRILGVWSGSVTNGACVQASVASSFISLTTPSSSPCGTGSGGANTALSNLAAVAINVNLLPGVPSGISLGNATLPFGDLFIGAASGAANDFNTTLLTTNRTTTVPDANTRLMAWDGTNFTPQTNINMGGFSIIGTGTIFPQVAGGSNLGSALLPFGNLYLSGSIVNTNNAPWLWPGIEGTCGLGATGYDYLCIGGATTSGYAQNGMRESVNNGSQLRIPQETTAAEGANANSLALLDGNGNADSGTIHWTHGAGAPGANCTIGDMYTNTSGGTSTTLYVCTATNTWTAK